MFILYSETTKDRRKTNDAASTTSTKGGRQGTGFNHTNYTDIWSEVTLYLKWCGEYRRYIESFDSIIRFSFVFRLLKWECVGIYVFRDVIRYLSTTLINHLNMINNIIMNISICKKRSLSKRQNHRPVGFVPMTNTMESILKYSDLRHMNKLY